MKQHDQAPLLPGMPKPAFGGVQLKPGMEIRKPWTGRQPSLLDPIPTGDLMDMLDAAQDEHERGANPPAA